ncbi:haloacid dehalogenase-like hydrolase domain-containing 2 [Brachionus plicatilis]|uniref:Haloacid dehalogenase-like hydrolase domain-containing protein 2 n=1 Tax=Brachionus plicatilis TaxID=10195 RepID=A0A3M7RLM3_BRAPC|nr:haloacid dehalogenase-like hydrolase domain-containing 2 [Brachionus plicatilis]
MCSMKPIKAVLIDLSGTLHIEDEEIPGSVQALETLRNCGKFNIKFVTNTTKESKRKLHSLLENLKFKIDENEIFTSLTAARKLIESQQLRPMLFLEPNAFEDFEGINTENPNSVVIGLAPDMFDYENLNNAFRLLLDGAKLVGIHKAKYYKRKNGLALGPGAFISALEFSSGTTAEIVGKPSKDFFMSSISEFNVDPEECVMIGDDPSDDIEGAHNAGFHGILVMTGKYRKNSEKSLTKKPLLLADNFAHAVEYLLSIT